MKRLEICPLNRGDCGLDIELKPKQVFVIMPFKEKYAPQSLFDEVLKPITDWNFIRVDESNYDITDGLCAICRDIQESAYVVADLSSLNYNVFLELGMAMGLGIPYILLTQDDEELKNAFDILGLLAIGYSRNKDDSRKIVDVDNLRDEILLRIKEVDESKYIIKYTEEQEDAIVKDLFKRLAKARIIKSIDMKLTFDSDISSLHIRIIISLLARYPNYRSIPEIEQEIIDSNVDSNSGKIDEILQRYCDKGYVEANTEDGSYRISPASLDEMVLAVKGTPSIMEKMYGR